MEEANDVNGWGTALALRMLAELTSAHGKGCIGRDPPFSFTIITTMSYDNAPLPDGWVREFDPTSKHPFWVRAARSTGDAGSYAGSVEQVDTKAQPPRSVWVHPYEDEQFLREHPDVRDRLAQDGPSGAPPPYSPRRHSYGGSPSDSHLGVPDRSDAMRTSHSQPGTPNPGQPHRGFFGKLKDKTIGTKEEREVRRQEEKRREELVSPDHQSAARRARRLTSANSTCSRWLSSAA